MFDHTLICPYRQKDRALTRISLILSLRNRYVNAYYAERAKTLFVKKNA